MLKILDKLKINKHWTNYSEKKTGSKNRGSY